MWSCLTQARSHQTNLSWIAWWLLKLLALLFARAVSVVLSSQLYCYICIHNRSTSPVQNSSTPLPTNYSDADSVWLSTKRTAQPLLVFIPEIMGFARYGESLLVFLNKMAWLGFGIVSSETHFKEELRVFFLMSLFVCKYRVSISRSGLLQVCVIAWLKAIHIQKLPSGM